MKWVARIVVSVFVLLGIAGYAAAFIAAFGIGSKHQSSYDANAYAMVAMMLFVIGSLFLAGAVLIHDGAAIPDNTGQEQ